MTYYNYFIELTCMGALMTQSFIQNNIEFIRLDGKENIYRITEDTFKHWMHLCKDNFAFFAQKNSLGEFIPYEDVFDNKHLVSNIKYNGAYKDLIPSGYLYYNGSNGIKYHKEVSRCTCIFISNAGNRISIEDLHHASGLLLTWLIAQNFTVECDKGYFICKNTGFIRKNSESLFDRALSSEREYYLHSSIVKELKRIYDNDDISFMKTHTFTKK
jgi:hypothetical protein